MDQLAFVSQLAVSQADPTASVFETEVEIPSMDNADDRFIVWAEATGHDKPLILTDLPPARLFDDIVVPYQTTDGTFFIDGAPVKAKDLRRIKILREKQPGLKGALWTFNRGLTVGAAPVRKTYGEQFNVRYEAILRQHSEDVTAQIIKAFDRAIKPSIKDYVPRREELIQAAMKVFVEAVKSLGTA